RRAFPIFPAICGDVNTVARFLRKAYNWYRYPTMDQLIKHLYYFLCRYIAINHSDAMFESCMICLTHAVWLHQYTASRRGIWQRLQQRILGRRMGSIAEHSPWLRDFYLDLFVALIACEERRLGSLPAWEGIRIVRQTGRPATS